jgi:hypothetical protein
MTAGTAISWREANQSYLSAALAVVRAALSRHAARAADGPAATEQDNAVHEALEAAASAMPAPAALETLCTTFGLSPFERDVLLLCAGVELDATIVALCTAAQGDPQHAYPTFSLALAALPDPDWGALTPDAPLRRWRLIEVGPGTMLTLSPLRIDERVLHYLVGTSHTDERLAGYLASVAAPEHMAPSHQVLAQRVADLWAEHDDSGALPVVQLCGGEVAERCAIATSAGALLGLDVKVMLAHTLPTTPSDLETLVRLWGREAVLAHSLLVLECDAVDAVDGAREHAIAWFAERAVGGIFLSGRQRRRTPQRAMITFAVHQPAAAEQRILWQSQLGSLAPCLNGEVEQLVAQFSLSALTIHTACTEAFSHLALQGQPAPDELGIVLWETCRRQARPRLDDLAQRIEPAATWDDLVLPEAQCDILRLVAAHVRQRLRVYETWGFARKGGRGLGISALFAGASGTGKTMAAEVLAHNLRLDLYRIDLSQVVSKYIGETEKNLRRVFDAAEAGATILLFDEADALFGKRSEVKDSHDRYANIEVSYLLQRMEAYRGLAILTTNMKEALDSAFLRRIRFVVQFPFPDAKQRAEIWQRIFPAETPTKGLDIPKLAQLNVAGGNIRNIALNAAFLAADAGEPVRMAHLLRAARGEYAKLEKPLTETELKGWSE